MQKGYKNILRLRRDTQMNYNADNVITALSEENVLMSFLLFPRFLKKFCKRSHIFIWAFCLMAYEIVDARKR